MPSACPVPSVLPVPSGQPQVWSDDALQVVDLSQADAHWLLKRNCSLSPRDLCIVLGSLGLVSVLIAGAFWWLGAPMVLPFACIELACLVVAVVVFARRSGDHELLWIAHGRFHVKLAVGQNTEEHAFLARSVRVRHGHDVHGLIELSADGRRVLVGRHLSPHRRSALAESMRGALRAAGHWGLEWK